MRRRATARRSIPTGATLQPIRDKRGVISQEWVWAQRTLADATYGLAKIGYDRRVVCRAPGQETWYPIHARLEAAKAYRALLRAT